MPTAAQLHHGSCPQVAMRPPHVSPIGATVVATKSRDRGDLVPKRSNPTPPHSSSRFQLPAQITVDEAATILRVSPSVVVRGLQTGQLPRSSNGDHGDVDGRIVATMLRTPLGRGRP